MRGKIAPSIGRYVVIVSGINERVSERVKRAKHGAISLQGLGFSIFRSKYPHTKEKKMYQNTPALFLGIHGSENCEGPPQ